MMGLGVIELVIVAMVMLFLLLTPLAIVAVVLAAVGRRRPDE